MVIETSNGFSKPTKLIIILIITKVKTHLIKVLSRIEVHRALRQTKEEEKFQKLHFPVDTSFEKELFVATPLIGE